MQNNYGSLRKVELKRVNNPYDLSDKWGYVELFVDASGRADATMWYNLTIDGLAAPAAPCAHWCNVPNNTCCKCTNSTTSQYPSMLERYEQMWCDVCNEAEKYET